MKNASRILELATHILENTTVVNDHLTATGHPQPSFDIDGPTNLTLSSNDAEKARIACIGASIELQDLMQGPIACLRPAVNKSQHSHKTKPYIRAQTDESPQCHKINATSLEAIYRYDIPSKVPLDDTGIPFRDLAERCDMYEPNLRRVLRYAMLYHRVFREPRAGYVMHSAASRLLVEDPAMFDALGLMFDESWQAFARTCDAMIKYNSQEPHETGYTLAHSPSATPWSHYATHPRLAKRFASAMTSLTSNAGQSPQYLATGYPWASLPAGSTVIDMGGSEGHVSVAIATEHDHLRFVVQDLADVISRARLGDEVEEGVKERVRFVAQDFMQEQRVEGEVFLLRWVCHDWPDGYVVRILRNLRPVLRDGDKVVVNDQVMPGVGEVSSVVERQIRFFDLVMLSFFNSREREKADWESLFRNADERFQEIRIWVPEGSSFGIIEATWRSH